MTFTYSTKLFLNELTLLKCSTIQRLFNWKCAMSLVSESGTRYGFRNPMCGNPKIGLCKINTCSTKKGKLMAPRKEKLMDIYIIVNMNIAFLFIISDTYISFRPCDSQFCLMLNSCEKSLLMCSLIYVEFKQWIYQICEAILLKLKNKKLQFFH